MDDIAKFHPHPTARPTPDWHLLFSRPHTSTKINNSFPVDRAKINDCFSFSLLEIKPIHKIINHFSPLPEVTARPVCKLRRTALQVCLKCFLEVLCSHLLAAGVEGLLQLLAGFWDKAFLHGGEVMRILQRDFQLVAVLLQRAQEVFGEAAWNSLTV